MKSKVLWLLILLLGFSVTGFSQKKVAILPVVDKQNAFTGGQKLMVRGILTDVITKLDGYEGYDRVNLSSILDEHKFQRSGYVSDDEIKRIGVMTGCQYVLVVTMEMFDTKNVVLNGQIIDAESAKIEQSGTADGINNIEGYKIASNKLVQRLLNVNLIGSSSSSEHGSVVSINRKKAWTEEDLKRAGFLMQSDYFEGIIDYEIITIDGINGPARIEGSEGDTYLYGNIVNGYLNGLVLLSHAPSPGETPGTYEIAYCTKGRVATPTIYVMAKPVISVWKNGGQVLTSDEEVFEANKNLLFINQYGVEDCIDITEVDKDENPMLEYLYMIFGKDITKTSFFRAFQSGKVDMELIQRNFDKFMSSGEKIPTHVWINK